MERIIQSMESEYLLPSLNLVEDVFARWRDPQEGKVVRALVEGKPRNYNPRGFEPSYRYGITPGPDIHLPHPDCLMVKALEEGALAEIRGVVDYSFYDALQ